MEKLKLSIAEIAAAASESVSVVYDGVKAGHLATFLVGRRRFARPEAVRRWVDFLESQSKAGTPVVYRARDQERVSKPAVPEPPLSRGSPGVARGRRQRV